MDGKNLEMLFAERGFVIKNPSVFTKEADNVDLNDLVDRLSTLEKKINSSANIVEFAKTITGKLDEIESVVNADDYAKLSDTTKVNNFNNDLKAMRSKFEKVQNFIKAENNMQFHKQNMFDVMRKIYDLDKNKTMDDAKRTSETLRLYGEKKACEDAYNKAYQFYNDQRKAYNDSVRGFSLVDFKNELLVGINSLQVSVKDLALAPESRDSLQALISDVRNDIAYYGLESIRSKTEFDSLCKRFGIESTGTAKKMDVIRNDSAPKYSAKEEPIKPVKKSEEFSIFGPKVESKEANPEYTGPVKKDQEIAPVEKSIKDRVASVYADLKKLNPDVEFNLVEEPVDSKFDGRIEASIHLQDLNLPEDFYYINNGISNKYSSGKDPVIIEVGELKRTEKIEPVEPIKDESEELGLFSKAKEAIARLTKKGRLEGDRKYAVKRSRKAIIGSYGKTLLTFSALSAVGLGIAGAPLVPAALVGAGFGAIAQTLYRKVIKNTDAHIEAFENTKYEDEPENAPVVVGAWHKASEALMDIYKKRKTGEIKTKDSEIDFAERLDEELDTLEENVSRSGR